MDFPMWQNLHQITYDFCLADLKRTKSSDGELSDIPSDTKKIQAIYLGKFFQKIDLLLKDSLNYIDFFQCIHLY